MLFLKKKTVRRTCLWLCRNSAVDLSAPLASTLGAPCLLTLYHPRPVASKCVFIARLAGEGRKRNGSWRHASPRQAAGPGSPQKSMYVGSGTSRGAGGRAGGGAHEPGIGRRRWRRRMGPRRQESPDESEEMSDEAAGERREWCVALCSSPTRGAVSMD